MKPRSRRPPSVNQLSLFSTPAAAPATRNHSGWMSDRGRRRIPGRPAAGKDAVAEPAPAKVPTEAEEDAEIWLSLGFRDPYSNLDRWCE